MMKHHGRKGSTHPSVLLQQYSSTPAKVLQYSFGSTTHALRASETVQKVLLLLLAALVFVPNLDIRAQQRCYLPLPTQEQLPVANINVIIQDHEGYMWYGTAGGGVCRDDGYEIIAYNSRQRGEGIMLNDEVTCIAEDQHNRIWFGTRAGTYYIDKTSNTLHRVEDEHVGRKKVNCIGVTPDGCIWIGIAQDIVKFSSEGRYLKTLSIGDNKREETKEFTIDSKGTLWMTILRGGIITIDPKTDQLTRQPWDYPSAASHIAEDTLHHCYWVGTWGGGIVRYPDMTPQPATLIATDTQRFGSEVHNLWIDPTDQTMWVSTMNDLYTYRIQSAPTPHLTPNSSLLTPNSSLLIPAGKKLINKLYADRQGNIWVPGHSPHTFILARAPSGSQPHRNDVEAMTRQMGYKIMVGGIVSEDGYFWIYQNRTRLSLHHPPTGKLSFMANHAIPTPLSTQRALAKCKSTGGVWTCNGRKLIHAWHEGMTIHWEEVADAQLPNYISALSDEGNGKLLIGTEKQVFLYDYQRKTLLPLTDSVGIVQQVGYDRQGKLTFTTDPKAAKTLTDSHGHVWTLNELTLKEYSPRTGGCRIIHASDPHIGMDYFTDITTCGDSICLGGIGAYCLIGHCKELDQRQASDPIIVTRHDSLHALHISTLHPLHAANIQFAYRFDDSPTWVTLPQGTGTIPLDSLAGGTHTLHVKATDRFGVWHEAQEVCQITLPTPWYLRWYTWCICALLLIIILGAAWKHRKNSSPLTPNSSLLTPNSSLHDPLCPDGHLPHNGESHPVSLPPHYGGGSGRGSSEGEHPFLAKVRELTDQHIDNPNYSIDDLSRDLGMSRMNLYRKFQSLSDTTPSEFMRHHRLQKAAQLLTTTDLSVTDISYQTGFTSPQYFAKCFKDEYGCSPRQWTKKGASPPHGQGS